MIGQIFAIARNTFREAVRNRIFASLVFFALLMMGITLAVSSASLNEEVRLMKDVGFFLISTFSVLIAVFTGVNLVYKELERKTIYTVMPKPIWRWQFLVGKYLGLAATMLIQVAVMTSVLGLLIPLVGGEIGVELAQAGWLVFVEVCVVLGVAMVFSSFSTPFLSGLLTLGVFAVGRFADVLSTLRLGAPEERTPLSEAISATVRAVADVTPDLSLYDVTPNLVYGRPITADYMLHASGLGLTYVALALLLSAVLFHRRDFT